MLLAAARSFLFYAFLHFAEGILDFVDGILHFDRLILQLAGTIRELTCGILVVTFYTQFTGSLKMHFDASGCGQKLPFCLLLHFPEGILDLVYGILHFDRLILQLIRTIRGLARGI